MESRGPLALWSPGRGFMGTKPLGDYWARRARQRHGPAKVAVQDQIHLRIGNSIQKKNIFFTERLNFLKRTNGTDGRKLRGDFSPLVLQVKTDEYHEI